MIYLVEITYYFGLLMIKLISFIVLTQSTELEITITRSNYSEKILILYFLSINHSLIILVLVFLQIIIYILLYV